MSKNVTFKDKEKARPVYSKQMLIGVFYRGVSSKLAGALACRMSDDLICVWIERDGFNIFSRVRVGNTLSQFVEVEEFNYKVSGEAVNEKKG